MDGNGRWARQRNLIRTQGHLEGLKAAKRTVKAASDLGIRFLTLYVFSTENWKRTTEEVGFIMGLVKRYLRGELDFYRENHIRIRHTGDPAGLPPDIIRELEEACAETAGFEGLQVVLALNYGGRDEVVRALRRFFSEQSYTEQAFTGKNMSGQRFANESISEESIRRYLDNPDIPDPDLIIRTGGDYRTSNFLLWEGAYSEYYFSDTLWPDWTEADLVAAVLDYQKRDRRFGGIEGRGIKKGE
jgi:undecaprenyl diphosphate synthase